MPADPITPAVDGSRVGSSAGRSRPRRVHPDLLTTTAPSSTSFATVSYRAVREIR
jgi:hypothetical protein